MHRALALLTIIIIAAFLNGCSSSSDTANSNASNSNVNRSNTSTPATNPAASNTAPTVGGAAPPQARPSASTQVGIKPPTKNGR